VLKDGHPLATGQSGSVCHHLIDELLQVGQVEEGPDEGGGLGHEFNHLFPLSRAWENGDSLRSPPFPLELFDLYAAIGCVDGEWRASAIQLSVQGMALLAVGLELVPGERQSTVDMAVAGMHAQVGGEVPGNAKGYPAGRRLNQICRHRFVVRRNCTLPKIMRKDNKISLTVESRPGQK
jgi:hypothetical protein